MMTITASTDSASRRRNDELDAAAAAPPPNDASRTAKSERPRENVEIGWDRRPTSPTSIEPRSTPGAVIAQARSQIAQPLPTSLCGAVGEPLKKQLAEDLKAMLPKLEKLEQDQGALRVAMHPYMKDLEEGLHAAHEMKEGIELALEGHHLSHGGGVPEKVLGGAAVLLGVGTLVHGAKEYAEVIAHLPPDAQSTVKNAKPIVADVMRDLDDLGASAKTALNHLMGGALTSRGVCIGG
jgi:hypothetical protein